MIPLSALLRRAVAGAALGIVPAAAVAGAFSFNAGAAILGLVVALAVFGAARAALLAGGLSVGTGLALAAVAMLPDAFYRPHDRYALDDGYPANLNASETMPHGDLVAVGGPAFAHAAQPRLVRFRTDALGYRNNSDPSPDAVLIVGDSFVAGHGNDQSDLLAGFLADAIGRPVYAAGFPGDLAAYAERVAAFHRPAWIFAFEGNDFIGDCSTDKDAPPLTKTLMTDLRRAVPLLAKARAYTVRARGQLRAILRDTPPSPPSVVEKKLGTGPMLVYRAYDDGTRRTAFALPQCAIDAVAAVAAHVRGIFFIPTKSRVYHGLMGDGLFEDLPHANWAALEALGQQAGVPVFDLTPAMRDAALNAYARDETLLFWRDDTHWNGHGAKAAAHAAAAVMRGDGA